MAKSRTNRVNELVVLVAVCVGSAIIGFALGNNKAVTARVYQPLLQQSDEKMIETYERPDELLEFSNLSVKKVKVAPSRKFSAASLAESSAGQVGDWLENLEFNLKNKSDKQITYVVFELQFPDTEVNGPLMVYRELRIGTPPKASRDALRYDGEPLALSPGDTTTVMLSAKHLEHIKHFIGLRNFQLSEMNKVVLKILSVFFDDGMKWESGRYYRPNPRAQGGYERINQ